MNNNELPPSLTHFNELNREKVKKRKEKKEGISRHFTTQANSEGKTVDMKKKVKFNFSYFFSPISFRKLQYDFLSRRKFQALSVGFLLRFS